MKYIEKDLEAEAEIKSSIAYLPLAGASEAENFRSPDCYVFIFFEKSSGIHSIDFVEYEEKNNQIHISFPGQIHSWKTEADAKGHKLIVSKKFIERYLYDTRFSSLQINEYPVVNISAEHSGKLSQEFNALKEELDAETVRWNIAYLRTQMILTLISNLLHENIAVQFKGKTNMLVHKFTDFIDLHFKEAKTVAFYADKLAVTPNYLSIISKKGHGISAKEIIDRRVVLEAKRLLLGSDFSIKEIAYELGFSSSPAFAAFFYGKTGFYPKDYRNNK